ncbi:MAG TPA: ATP-dependent DNA helicase RecG [Gaiellaceae bacterium]|jgi:ATP-dependent DNA helicase RecG|nr:ATP-dependent DNA helicase RecG [Gaiellaceae bacterium]
MTASRRQTVFAGLVQPPAWPVTRGAPKPARLERELDALPGVGAALKRKLAHLGLRTVRDLLEHRPRRYESAVDEVPIASLGATREEVAIAGEVLSVAKRPLRGRRTMVTARIDDGTATVSAAWFNQPWLEEQLRPGVHVRLRGKPGRYGFDVKSHDIGKGDATADFAPVYPASEEIAAKRLRTLVAHALGHVVDYVDPLPAELRDAERLPLKRDALVALHRPESEQEAEAGRARLAFEELLLLQLGIARRAAERERTLAPSLGAPGELIERYRRALPFALTPYQEQAVREIDDDLERTVPMQRLLQGDVGSGKTVVALYAILRAVEHGRQGALMAPTETLAEQHFLTIEGICAELGVTCALLTSASPKRVRDAALHADVVVGTHALIQEGVDLRDLAVAVVDEQHRFGVEQRTALMQGRAPHVLHMTATPIPRTLALTVYGDLAVSEIAKPPSSRKPIVTRWIPEERTSEAYTRLTRLLRDGRQAYVVCPLVEASETTLARAAEEEAERLRRAELRDFRVGCLHGRMKPDERRETMRRFNARELDVLVATTVIEVGVDVPNATVMIVQEADRFGLAQLHQLRGRVGRGAEQSYCLLVSRTKDELTETAQRRLDALVATTDGFELAEVDLDLRGGGQLLGTRQHGVSDLRFARVRLDRPLLERARAVARELPAGGPLADDVEAMFAATDPAALA